MPHATSDAAGKCSLPVRGVGDHDRAVGRVPAIQRVDHLGCEAVFGLREDESCYSRRPLVFPRRRREEEVRAMEGSFLAEANQLLCQLMDPLLAIDLQKSTALEPNEAALENELLHLTRLR